MMRKYSINSKTITYVFRDVFLMTIGYTLIFAFIGYGLEEELPAYYFGLSITSVVFVATTPLPVLIFLSNYLRKGGARTLTTTADGIILDNRCIGTDEIEKVKVIGTYQLFNGGSASTLAYNPYFYYLKITLINGETIILNSLLGFSLHKDLRKLIGEHKFENVIKAFPLIEK